ncbi:hypothetical protein GCM10022397_04010 [Flavivirga jejuensis]
MIELVLFKIYVFLVDDFKDFIIFNGSQIKIYCNLDFRYKTNEKKMRGSLNTLLN